MTISYFFGNGFSGCFLTLQDKYEKELKDAAIRELMLAEEAAMLDKVGVYFFQPPCCSISWTSLSYLFSCFVEIVLFWACSRITKKLILSRM